MRSSASVFFGATSDQTLSSGTPYIQLLRTAYPSSLPAGGATGVTGAVGVASVGAAVV